MDEEIYTVEDIFERDTPLTEDLLDNSDGFTLSPITMLRRYMAEKELKKQNEDFEEAAEDMSMGYMNGGGIGSMMQPRQNYAIGGDIEQSDFGLQNIINSDLSGNQNMRTAGFFSKSPAENALENIQDLRQQQNSIKSLGEGAIELKQDELKSIQNQIQNIKNQNIDNQEFKDIGGQTARLSYDKLNNGIMSDANTSLFNNSTTPTMSIEDQIQGNIDRITSTPGFEGYTPSTSVVDQLGSTGFERPNMADIAGPGSVTFDDSIQVQDLSPSARIRSGFKGPGGSDDRGRLTRTVDSTIGATPNINSFPGIRNIDSPLGTIANPEIFNSYGASVDDPQVGDPGFEGYTPSFDKEELTGLAGLIDSLKGYDFKNAFSPANLGTGAVGSKLAGSLNLPGYLGSLGLNALRKKTGNFGFDKIKKNTTTAVTKDKKIASDRKIADQLKIKKNLEAKQARKDELSRRQSIANAQAARGQTTSGGAGNYRSDRDNSRDGGYGGSSKRSADNRSSDLGFSDIRLKDNIELVGKSPSDINIYNFTYLNNPKVYQGVMAHEVPWASVKHDNGYLMVDYNKVDVEFKIVH